MADKIKFKFKGKFREQIANETSAMREKDQFAYTGPTSNYTRSSAYRNPQADIRYHPENFTSAGFVSPDYPQTAFILGRNGKDTIPHEVAHTQQNLAPSDRLTYKGTEGNPYPATRHGEYKEALQKAGQFDTLDDLQDFARNGKSPRELAAYLQGEEGALPEDINVFDKKYS